MNIDSDFSYNYGDRNCCLITSDTIQFNIDYQQLSNTSAFWNSLFELPQPSSTSTSTNDDRVIHMQESSSELKPLLQVISNKPIQFNNIDHIKSVINLAIKYDSDKVLNILRADLFYHAFNEPLRAYALAAKLGWESDAVRISTLTLESDIENLSDADADSMPTHYYRRLAKLHQTRQMEARRILISQDLMMSSKHEGDYDRPAHVDWWNTIQQAMLRRLDGSHGSKSFKFPTTMPYLDCVKNKAYVDGDKDVLSFRGLYLIYRTMEVVETAWKDKLPKSI